MVLPIGNIGRGQLGTPKVTPDEKKIDGDPYLLPEWNEGVVYSQEHPAEIKITRIKYNVFEEQIEYERDGGTFILDRNEYPRFVLIQGHDSIVFVRKERTRLKSVLSSAYFQEVFHGRNEWLKKDTKALIDDPVMTYGVARKKILQSDHAFYLIAPNSRIFVVKPTEKFFKRKFDINTGELNSFLKENALSLDKESDLKSIFRWLDSKVSFN
ncbi:hypothetical protein WSM22_08290 [Cytophagales bacterium WSM2-2]|nr:hypothetical protein WSM22_08290 [Cytophagales bacterium WSM2-2]